MLIESESGDWCEKYNNWIFENTIKQCKNEENYVEKGCVNCKFSTSHIQEKKESNDR